MSKEEFKKQVDETLRSIYSKIDEEEKIFLSYVVNRFNEICERNNNAIEYINFLAIGTQGIKEELLDKCEMGMIKFNKTMWGEELLDLLKGDKE